MITKIVTLAFNVHYTSSNIFRQTALIVFLSKSQENCHMLYDYYGIMLMFVLIFGDFNFQELILIQTIRH